MAEWDPEIDVDAAAAAKMIAAQFPELRDAPVEPFAAGWDNTVHLVDGRWAFRFPRRAMAIPGVEREIEVLPRLAGHLPLAIPLPRYVGAPSDDYPWPWFGAPFIGGVELPAADVADARREPLAASVGGFLRALHAPGLARRAGGGLPVDPMGRADMRHRVPFARARLTQLEATGRWRRSTALEKLLDDAGALPPPPRTTVLHGDLHVRHVLVTPDGAAAGIIDWGDVALGDPSVDLSVAYAAFVGPARQAFLQAYGPVDGLTQLRARVIGAFLSAALAAYAVDAGLVALEGEALAGLDRVVR
jgi:aminoglycoside phosphotransferase (APT) family kinase protein